MAEFIDCRNCESPNCRGCNVYILDQALKSGRLDGLKGENNTIRIPAADVRPVVRGRWIKKGCYAVCSNCGERKAIAWTTTVEELVNVYRLKFCNNCGADMRENATR